jgi:hypothetical protein
MFDATDYSAYPIEHLNGTRWICIRIRGNEYGLNLDEANSLYLGIRSAFQRACDPTPLPAAAPLPEHKAPQPAPTHRRPHLSLEDISKL